VPNVQHERTAAEAARLAVSEPSCGTTVVSDDEPLPFYAPNKPPIPGGTPRPGEEVWRLRKDDRVLTCELRNDERAGAGCDVQLLEGAELRASRRCVDVNGARFVAESYRQDLVRTGWRESRPASRLAVTPRKADPGSRRVRWSSTLMRARH
jgi:hypothetical protein